jgi:hypothetical protein
MEDPVKSIYLCLAAALLSFTVATNASACITFQNAFSTTFKDDANLDINDYGRIHHDADDVNCAQAAMYSLTEKLRIHLDSSTKVGTGVTFQQWLDGFLVAEIYGAAMRIGANGWASKDLDDQLVRLAGRFQHNTTEPSGVCGGAAFNTCMDDLTGTASGYAWMAAYMKRRPNRFTQQQVDDTIYDAVEFMEKALKPVTATEPKNGICLRDTPVTSGSFTTICTGTLAELKLGTAEAFSVNHSQQSLAYGFGLMTSIASAKKGLELAGSTFAFTADQKVITKALMEEAQRHINTTTRDFNSDCVFRNSVTGQISFTRHCGEGAGAYLPDMYALRAFYDTYLGGMPNAGGYDSNSFDPDLFQLQTDDNGHFSYGRFETYGIQGYAWFVNSRTWMPGDAYNPTGGITSINSSGVAQGWACDADMPGGRVFVDFYVDNGATYVATATASASDPTRSCGTGTARSFSVQLPPSSKTKTVRAWGIDYTWYGTTELSCSQSPCSW